MKLESRNGSKEYSDEEKIHAYQTVIKFYELIFEDGDLGFYHCRLAFLYRFIAAIYSKLHNPEKTIENLALAANHSTTFDTAKDHMLTSPLVDAVKYEPRENSQNWIGTHSKLLLECLSEECFNFCREDKQFKEIAANLYNYA